MIFYTSLCFILQRVKDVVTESDQVIILDATMPMLASEEDSSVIFNAFFKAIGGALDPAEIYLKRPKLQGRQGRVEGKITRDTKTETKL
jgi:hypothetical protein